MNFAFMFSNIHFAAPKAGLESMPDSSELSMAGEVIFSSAYISWQGHIKIQYYMWEIYPKNSKNDNIWHTNYSFHLNKKGENIFIKDE